MSEDWKAAQHQVWLSAGLRAFTVTMWVIALVALGVAAGQISHADVMCEQLGQHSCPTPQVQAQPVGLTCTHRGEAHAAQQHTTREADSRWHVEHGQLPTCDLDSDKSHDDHEDNAGDSHLLPRRDHEGFHCTWHGCG